MQAILFYSWQLFLLRQGPERIPPSYGIAGLLALINLIVQLISLTITRLDLDIAVLIMTVLVEVFLKGIMIYWLLLFKRFAHRLPSVLSALFIANTLIIVLLLPVNYFLTMLEPGLIDEIVETIALVLLLWGLVITGFILQRAANTSMIQGVGLAFAIEFLALFILMALFPQLLGGV